MQASSTGAQVVERLLGGVTVGDERRQQAGGARADEDVVSPLGGDQRLVVGRGDDAAGVLVRRRHQRLGGCRGGALARLGVAQRLRGDPVLAIGAVHVAAEHAE